jgi:hypothetical protein
LEQERCFFCFSRILEKKARRLWIEEGQCKIQECEALDRGLVSKSHTAAATATALKVEKVFVVAVVGTVRNSRLGLRNLLTFSRIFIGFARIRFFGRI